MPSESASSHPCAESYIKSCYAQSACGNLALVGQQQPGVILADGRIVDGNRRYTCLRRIQRESGEKQFFETVIMNADMNKDRKQIKLLELSIQHGEEENDFWLDDFACFMSIKSHYDEEGMWNKAWPEELRLYKKNGKYYVSENVAPEVYALRKETKDLADASVADAKELKGVAANMEGAFEIEADVTPDANGIAGIEISNNKRERTLIYFDMKQGKVVMDRTESGLTDFGKQAVPHDIELAWDKQRAAEGKEPARITNSINYKNDFALATWAPLSLCEDGKKTYHVDVFVDKSSIELFVDGGRIAMTNLVFPVAPYENVKLYSKDGKAEFKNMKVYKLGL